MSENLPNREARRAARLAAPAVALIALLGGCVGEPATIVEVYGRPDSRELELGVSTCNADPTVSVEESASEVRLKVLAREARSGGDCRDGVIVTLDAPLGNRSVIDEATDEVLSVGKPDG
jgi:hypothetical protein